MRTLIKFGIYFFTGIILFFLHLTIINFLPYPINTINVLFITLTVMIVIEDRFAFIWFIVPMAFLLELFSVAPFGSELLSLFLSAFAMRSIILRFFTNRTIYIVLLTSVLGLIIYRVSYIIITLILGAIIHLPSQFSYAQFLFFGWETILSSIFASIIYIIFSKRYRQYNPNYLIAKNRL